VKAQVSRRLAVMEARHREQYEKQQPVDLSQFSDDDLEELERLALRWQAWSGSLDEWLASLSADDHAEVMRLHALARL
jgi:hypothetical protein